jgi:hypothetical protein
MTLQGESKKTDTFVIHLNIKCISFFDSPCIQGYTTLSNVIQDYTTLYRVYQKKRNLGISQEIDIVLKTKDFRRLGI